jgi:hypothetical protein
MGGGGGGGIPKPKVSIDRLELLARRERGEPLDFGNLSSALSSSSSAAASVASSSSSTSAYLNHFGHTFQQLQHADRFALRPPRPHGTEPFYAFTVCVVIRVRELIVYVFP